MNRRRLNGDQKVRQQIFLLRVLHTLFSFFSNVIQDHDLFFSQMPIFVGNDYVFIFCSSICALFDFEFGWLRFVYIWVYTLEI